MDAREVRLRAFAMPLTSPAFPPGPYRFVNREFFVVTYRTDPDALRAVLPAPLEFSQPVADLPVREVLSGTHIVADLTLGLGMVVHDYLAS